MSKLNEISDKVIELHSLKSIEDVVNLVPSYMCHVLQECEVFDTYPPSTVKLTYPKEEWEKRNKHYARMRDEVIPNIGLTSYLNSMLEDFPKERLPCFCSETADVAAVLVSRILNKRVYSLRNIFVKYLVLPQRWHCINCIEWEGRIRFFDSSAYEQIIDPETREVVHPSKLPEFDASDIHPKYIMSRRWLQNKPYDREVWLKRGHVIDTFYPSPVEDKPEDEYLRVF